MYQPNYYSSPQAVNQQGQGSQQQMFNQQAIGNAMQEEDWGKLLLSELKRTAREYTTAALEASHPSLCQVFQNLVQKTLQDQAQLFSVLSQLNGYSRIPLAQPQEIQQELQQGSQKATELQSLVQHGLQVAFAAEASTYHHQYQQQMEQHGNVSYEPQGQAGASPYSSYSNNSTKTSSGFASGQSDPQGYSQGYSQGYAPGYTRHLSGANSPAYTSSSSVGPTRGGNSFNWTASDEGKSTPTTESPQFSQSSQSRSSNSSGKYML